MGKSFTLFLRQMRQVMGNLLSCASATRSSNEIASLRAQTCRALTLGRAVRRDIYLASLEATLVRDAVKRCVVWVI